MVSMSYARMTMSSLQHTNKSFKEKDLLPSYRCRKRVKPHGTS